MTPQCGRTGRVSRLAPRRSGRLRWAWTGNIILAVSLNLVTGFTGQFSLGHAGFMAVGAYATAMISTSIKGVWGFVLGLVVGALLAAIIGFLIGLPTLRLRGDYLAIATLGMAEIIRVLLLNFKFTNGAAGLSAIPRNVNRQSSLQ